MRMKLQHAGLWLACVALASGCTGTRAAYVAAEGKPDQVAYVIAEQYSSVLHEAADLKESPSTPAEVTAGMQRADLAAQPAVDKLRPAANAYTEIKVAQEAAATAEGEAALQAAYAKLQTAINDAVALIAEVIEQVKKARGAQR